MMKFTQTVCNISCSQTDLLDTRTAENGMPPADNRRRRHKKQSAKCLHAVCNL